MQRATILHTLPDLRLGGGQVLLLRLIEQLDDFGHIVVAVGDGDLRAAFDNSATAVHVVGPSTLGAARRAGTLARRHRVDLVHTNNTPADRLIGQVAATVARRPVINTFHSLPTLHTGPLGRVRRSVNRLLSKSSRVSYTAVSHHVAGLYIDALGLADDAVTVIHPGIAVGDFAGAIEAPADLPRETADRMRFVSVSRLTPAKNMELIVDAMDEVRAIIPGADLLIVGDGPERARLESRISELGLGDAVHLLGQRSDVANILNQCDVFVTATQLEGFGMAPVEAMACGLPVVACDIPVFREFIDDSVGRLVARDELAGAMIELAQDAELRATCSAAAHTRASTFTIERYAGAVAAAYEHRMAGPDSTT